MFPGLLPGTAVFILLLGLSASRGCLSLRHAPASWRALPSFLTGQDAPGPSGRVPRSPGGGAGDPGSGWVLLWLLESSFPSPQLCVYIFPCVRPCLYETRDSPPQCLQLQPLRWVSTAPPAYLSLPTQQWGTCSSARHPLQTVLFGSGCPWAAGSSPDHALWEPTSPNTAPCAVPVPRLQAQTPRGSE